MEYFLVVPLAYLYFRLDEKNRPAAITSDPSFVPAAAAALGVGFVMTGVAHLAYADFYSAILPSWMPEKEWVSWLSGWLRLAAGFAMMQPILRRAGQVVIFAMLMVLLPHSVQFASLFDYTGSYEELPWAWSRLACHLGWLGWTLWCIVPLDVEPQEVPMSAAGRRYQMSPERRAWTL